MATFSSDLVMHKNLRSLGSFIYDSTLLYCPGWPQTHNTLPALAS